MSQNCRIGKTHPVKFAMIPGTYKEFTHNVGGVNYVYKREWQEKKVTPSK